MRIKQWQRSLQLKFSLDEKFKKIQICHESVQRINNIYKHQRKISERQTQATNLMGKYADPPKTCNDKTDKIFMTKGQMSITQQLQKVPVNENTL